MKRKHELTGGSGRSRAGRAAETDQEIEAHLAMHVDDLVAAGMSEAEAHEAALARFGDVRRARREISAAARHRDRRLGWMEGVGGIARDVRIALRRARSDPGHAAMRVAIFGIGIALTTVMFTIVDNVLLRPLPFPAPERLVALYSVPDEGVPFPWVSMGNWFDWQSANRTLESTAIHSQTPRDITVGSADGAFTVPGVSVYGAFFETFAMPMVAGRAPSADEAFDETGQVVVSESFWRRVMGGGELSGRVLQLDNRPTPVVGVVADGHGHPEGVDVWLPRPHRPQTGAARNNINFRAVARLAPGISLEAAAADLTTIAQGVREADPEAIYSAGVDVRPLDEVVVGEAGEYLSLLMGAVVMVLLIGCTNLAALGYARGVDRSTEVAVRLSLGAGRGRLVRQLVTEEILLALAGGVAGVALAWWGTSALLDSVGSIIPRSRDVGFDARVAAFGVAMSLLAGCVAGLPPALRTALGGPARGLAGARAVRGRRGLPGSLLIAGEVALTALLLTGGGLLLMSVRSVASRDLGFDPTDVVTLEVALTAAEYRERDERVLAYWREVTERLEQSPGTRSVGLGNWIPTGGGGTGFIALVDDPDPETGAGYRVVGGDYFETLSIPLVEGRSFDDRDAEESELVTLVNQAMADALWPGGSPIGQRVRAVSMESYWFGGEAPWRTVVGVVGTVRHHGFEAEPRPEMFVPYRQMRWMSSAMTAVVRLQPGEGAATLARLRSEVQALDPSLAVNADTLERRLDRLLSERRMIATLLGGFSLAALALACLGIFGVISLAVAQRTREMAIRAALGADRSGLVRLVAGHAFRLIAVGAGVGLLLAVAMRRVLDALLVDVTSGHPLAYAGAAATLLVVASSAALVPAWKASRLDPRRAFREG